MIWMTPYYLELNENDPMRRRMDEYGAICKEEAAKRGIPCIDLQETFAEILRHTDGNKEIYDKRKETIERIFGTAKEFHGFSYTNMIGKARMEMEVGLTFACLNLKKLATILWKKRGDTISNTFLSPVFSIFSFFHNFLSLKRLKRC